ncbi:MAG: toxic anion resistance protein, partial [Lachnospiraceae bacterium]|nr:toxic anion resistance protein [Lachnospiraceae bacterium]
MSTNLDEMLKEAPSLTLEPFTEPSAAAVADVMATANEVQVLEGATQALKEVSNDVPEAVLTPEEQKMVDDFASKIDITNTQMVMQYGVGSQKKIADFSESALNNVRTKDMGEIGQMLTGVVAELKGFDEEEKKGILGIFKKSSHQLANLKAKYDKAEVNVNKICKVMEDHQVTLLKDAAMLDKMYELNLNYFKELSMYIVAGKQKLKQARTEELPKLLAKAEQSGLPEDTQAANDYAAMCERFEKKIYDLELTRTISMQ